jgi:hypothetical protein
MLDPGSSVGTLMSVCEVVAAIFFSCVFVFVFQIDAGEVFFPCVGVD